MHRYQIYEVSEGQCSELPTGKIVELDSQSSDRLLVVKTVLQAYGFTEYSNYYDRFGIIGDATITLRYSGDRTVHWVLRKL